MSQSSDGHIRRSCWSLAAADPVNQRKPSTAVATVKWEAPPNGVVKLNTDAAFLSTSGQSWAGVVARNNSGLVFYSASKAMAPCKSVEEAEGLAILLGLTSLSRLYRGPLMIETDNNMMANELRRGGANRSEWFWVVSEIKNAMQVFRSVQIKAIKRGQNSLAHELAARARRQADCLMIADVPEELRSLMLSECTK